MEMKITVKSVAQMMKERGLGKGSRVQWVVDNDCIKFMKPYTPNLSGILEGAATRDSVLGSGLIVQNVPYAHYQYMGIVYGPNFPQYDEFGVLIGWKSPPRKYPTTRALKYNTGTNKLAGKQWFHRMKADRLDDILKDAAIAAGGTPVK